MSIAGGLTAEMNGVGNCYMAPNAFFRPASGAGRTLGDPYPTLAPQKTRSIRWGYNPAALRASGH